MKRTANGVIVTGEPDNGADHYYVSVISPDGRDYILAAGPYDSEATARAREDEVFSLIRDFKDSAWMSVGTCGVRGSAPAAKWGVL